MNIRQSLLGQAVLLGAVVIYGATVARTLGPRVPIHWGLDGKPDGWGSPAFALWFGPCMVAFMMLMTWGLPKISPKKFEIDRFEATYGLMMFLVTAMMAVIHVVILMSTAGRSIPIDKALMVVIGLFFAVFGNFMGKVRRNFYMGVRTPWTLSSEKVWDATHRAAGMLWFFGGLILAALAIVGVPFLITITLMLAMCFWPIAQSYLFYRKLENN